jgi:hypothetical protein
MNAPFPLPLPDPGPAHAVYAPSSAERWLECTASAEAIVAFFAAVGDPEEGEEAEEGTAAHDEIERCLGPLCETNLSKDPMPYPVSEPVDDDHPAAFGVALVIDFVRKLVLSALGGKLWIEQRVRLTKDIWGRCDVCHWDPVTRTLTIVDYKNGFVDVQATRNPQLMIYAAGSIYTHQLPALWVRLVVVQPNSIVPGPRVKQDVLSVDDLMVFAQRAANVPAGPKSFKVGEQCTYCPLFGHCEATKDVLLQFNAVVANRPQAVPTHQVALFMALKKPIADWFKALEKEQTKVALKTAPPPGMMLVTGTKHRTWRNADVARAEIFAAKGVEALDPPSPAQAEELGLGDIVARLAEKPEGGPVLAFESDKRKPWTGGKSAAEMFPVHLIGKATP